MAKKKIISSKAKNSLVSNSTKSNKEAIITKKSQSNTTKSKGKSSVISKEIPKKDLSFTKVTFKKTKPITETSKVNQNKRIKRNRDNIGKKPTQNSQINLTRKSSSKSEDYDTLFDNENQSEDLEDLTSKNLKQKDVRDDDFFLIHDDTQEHNVEDKEDILGKIGDDEEQLLDNIIGDWSGIDNLPPEH
ncbi:hypothetical protein IPJ91_02860 [bacterium]|nr:MAG: hypothetical protein IPJ91_02860 [bacterium]